MQIFYKVVQIACVLAAVVFNFEAMDEPVPAGSAVIAGILFAVIVTGVIYGTIEGAKKFVELLAWARRRYAGLSRRPKNQRGNRPLTRVEVPRVDDHLEKRRRIGVGKYPR